MIEPFKICLTNLHEDKVEEIAFDVDPDFLDVDEPELSFKAPVSITGQAYIAGDELIVRLNAVTEALIPCNVCTEPVRLIINCEGIYHTVPLAEIKGNVYEFHEAIREDLLLEVPNFVECSGGKCPERKTIDKFLKKEGTPSHCEGQQPFSNLL